MAGLPLVFRTAAPAGFDRLLAPQQAVVDVYHGGRSIGQARVRFSPGHATFLDIDAVLALVPDLVDVTAARSALAGPELDTHAGLLCPPDGGQATCGTLRPANAGIIFDQGHFRIDLFFHPRLLAVHPAGARRYLSTPDRRASLIDQIGGTVAGNGSYLDYAPQNRAILALGQCSHPQRPVLVVLSGSGRRHTGGRRRR